MTARIAAALAGIALAASANAAEPGLSCRLAFTSSDWSALYQRAEGSGTVTCSDGSSMPVRIHAKGIGLSAGNWKIANGKGRFTRLHRIEDVPGHYLAVGGNAGLVKSGAAQLAMQEKAYLWLAGIGDGFDVGVSISDFLIERAPAGGQ